MPSSKPDPALGRVFDALADPTRRSILDLLRRHDVMTAGEIAAEFPRISRPAVSRHLRVLRGARLLIATEQGREVHYRLDPEPLHAMQQRYLAAFAPMWDTALRRLKQRAESDKTERRGRKRETPARRKRTRAT